MIVPFEKDKVKKYLDTCIIFWRKKRDGDSERAEIAEYYIDAYQSVRISLFGEVLDE